MRNTWIDVAPDSPWGAQTLPYAVADMSGPDGDRTGIVVRIGDTALDVGALSSRLAPLLAPLLAAPSLDPLLAAGPQRWAEVRAALTAWVTQPSYRDDVEPHLVPVDRLRLRLPFTVADYVDFYSSRHHAENLGALFRPGQPALPANWLHLPIGYHGRSGTVVVTGTDVVRPHGQTRTPDAPAPTFGPSRRLDIEAEVGFVVGVPSAPGWPVSAEALADHVFGVVLVNDWSARDLQSWEYVPLGPFLGKSFATSVSAWVTPLAALRDARVAVPQREVPVLPYLATGDDEGLNVDLVVELNGEPVSRPPFAPMYWSPAHQLAHLTANGAHLRTGDLFASGTVSGPEPGQRGSFIELTWNGTAPLTLSDGSVRTFLEDGDEVVLHGTARRADGVRVGLGEVRGRILPAR